MKRLLLLLLLASGCSNIDATTARRYKCDHAATDVQCPGGWQCTLDGFCADPDAGVDLACARDADCTGGWQCAKTNRCVDPAVGVDLPCDRTADCTSTWQCAKSQRCVDPLVGLDLPCDRVEDCTGGWKCARTQRCVDPAVGRALPCLDGADCTGGWICGAIKQCLDPDAGVSWPCHSELDCTGGWHCGLGPICYDLATAGAVACRADAGDCAPGWRCGLEAFCHDTSMGAPLPCTLDTDCDQGWRCDVGGHCIDSAQDALRPTGDAGVGLITRLPSFVPDLVDAVSTSEPLSLAGKPARYTAFLGDGGLTVAISGVGDFGKFSVDGGPLFAGLAAQVSAPPGARAVSITGGATPLIWAAIPGGLVAWEFRPPSQLVQVATVSLPFTPRHLRLLDHTNVAAFDATHLAVRFGDGGLIQSTPAATTGITDVTMMPASILPADGGAAGPETMVVLLLSASGSFASPWPGSGNWQRIALEKSGDILLERVGFLPDQNGAIGYGFVPSQQNRPQVVTLAFTAGNDLGYARLTQSPGKALVATAATMDPRCTGEVLALTGGAADGGSPEDWKLFCRADGGVDLDTGTLSPTDPPIHLPPGFALSEDNPRELIRAGQRQAWLIENNGSPVPLVPTQSADRFIGTASAPYLVTAARPRDATGLEVAAAECARGHTPWLWCRGPSAVQPGTRVTGRPDWSVVDSNPVFGLNAPPFVLLSFDLHQVDTTFDFLALSNLDFGPVGAAGAVGPDGGTQLVIAGDDHLYWSNIVPLTPQAPRFHFATVPQPGTTITSLAPVPADPANVGARFAEGYLIASGRMYRYAADNEVVWRAQELVIGGAEALQVWADGRRGRVIFRDGAVYGLPSRVQLAAPISPGATSVIAVEAYCGQTFALATDGLYRLRAGGAALATWDRLDLLGATPSTFPRGRLIGGENSLLVMLPEGQSRVLSGFGCLP